jgi:alkyl hydroperoxide reductase subunit F
MRTQKLNKLKNSTIYAAGDVTTIPFKQIITAMGDGAKVALSAFEDRMRMES